MLRGSRLRGKGSGCRVDGCRSLVQKVGWFDAVNGDSVQRTIAVDRDSLAGPPHDTVRSLVRRRERRMDCVDADEDVSAAGEVLAHEGLSL